MAGHPSRAPSRRPPQTIPSRTAEPRGPALTGTSWSARCEMTLAEWMRHGRSLGAVARASGWWIGDWVRFGNARYGEKYEAAARISGYDVQSLMNMAYVASRFEVSRRRENLSFTHHAEVAALTREAQERWLDVAELDGLSSRRLRQGVQREARLRRAARAELAELAEASQAPVCPNCGYRLS